MSLDAKLRAYGVDPALFESTPEKARARFMSTTAMPAPEPLTEASIERAFRKVPTGGFRGFGARGGM